MRREAPAIAAACLAACLPLAHGQKLDIKPAVDAMATATTNASPDGAPPRKDLVLSVTPEITASYQGARSRIDAHLKVENLHFVRNSQTDRSLPSGELLLHSDLVEHWGGLEASVVTAQTQANLLSRPITGTAFANTYTTTQTRVAPFVQHAFDANTLLTARFERSVTESSEEVAGLGERPSSQLSRHSVRLERQPVPLGASLDWTYEDTQDSGQAASSLKTNEIRGGVSYALNDVLRVGLILGRESVEVPYAPSQDDTIRGVTLRWHPNERATLNSTVERRFFGTGWKVDWNHRLQLLNWSLNSERDASTYAAAFGGNSVANAIGTAVGTAPGTVATPGAGTAAIPGNPLAYSSTATLRQTWQGRVAIVGQRNTVSLAGGMDKTSPLGVGNVQPLGDQTTSRFVEAQFVHKLTPLTSLNTSVRWTQTNVGNQATAGLLNEGRTRNLQVLGAINTRLSPQATATFGLRHQAVDSTLPNTSDESALFVGLGYRY